ncbi:MAG: hypothetical protein AAF628_30045 [Planctomycetota bacterium]
MKNSILPVVVLACSAATLCAQRSVMQLTTMAQVHQDAKISPDGGRVAFRGSGGSISVVDWLGGAEVPIAVGINIGSFLWSPRSSGVYFVENNSLRFASVAGGSPTTLAILPGNQVQLWCVDSADFTVYGTRFEPTNNWYTVFTINTTGAGFRDIVTDPNNFLDEVRLDPTETRIVYRAQFAGLPFADRDYISANVDGTMGVSLTGGPIPGNPEFADWVDGGTTIALTMLSGARPHIARVSTGLAPQFVTDGSQVRRRTVVSPDRRWIAFEAQWERGLGPAVIPSEGGGLVVLSQEDDVNYIMQAPPSVSEDGNRIAFSASVSGGLTQVYGVELDRELRIFPRVERGGVVTVELPVTTSEIGALFVSGGLGATPFPFPGYSGEFAINPFVMFTLFAASSTTGAITVSFPVPNAPALVGGSVYFQGLRFVSLNRGDFTRVAEALVF